MYNGTAEIVGGRPDLRVTFTFLSALDETTLRKALSDPEAGVRENALAACGIGAESIPEAAKVRSCAWQTIQVLEFGSNAR